MTITTHDRPITFRVHDVEPRKVAWETVPLYENVKTVIGGSIESCSDYHKSVCARMNYQPLLAAVYQAYSLHYPLVLSPDAVWLTISQGVAHHMAIHGERLRNRFVAHQGRLDLVFACDGWIPSTPENPWEQAFAAWSSQIREHVGTELYQTLICDFSTTTAVERAASEVVMMDIFEKYFRYVMVGICGIPEITLRGTSRDWERLAEKVDYLDMFDLSWWLDQLKPIVEHFARASKGDVDVGHWRNICKLEEAYGGHIINGWIAKLFPYLRAFFNGPCSQRNPIFETGEGFRTFEAPSGLSQVPFVWQHRRNNTERRMEAIAGLVGVTQDEATLALEPIAGWAVREASELDVAMQRLKCEHTVRIPNPDSIKFGSVDQRIKSRQNYPSDLERFYYEFDEARLFADENQYWVHIGSRKNIESIDWGEELEELASRGPGGRTWFRFAYLPKGEYLAINLDANLHLVADDEKYRKLLGELIFHPICVVSEQTRSVYGKNPVIALTFTELITRILSESTSSKPYWKKEGFVPYADADDFTRREMLDVFLSKRKAKKRQ